MQAYHGEPVTDARLIGDSMVEFTVGHARFRYIPHRGRLYLGATGRPCHQAADGTLCFDGCEKAGLQEPSPFCRRYQAILRDTGAA